MIIIHVEPKKLNNRVTAWVHRYLQISVVKSNIIIVRRTCTYTSYSCNSKYAQESDKVVVLVLWPRRRRCVYDDACLYQRRSCSTCRNIISFRYCYNRIPYTTYQVPIYLLRDRARQNNRKKTKQFFFEILYYHVFIVAYLLRKYDDCGGGDRSHKIYYSVL